MPPLTLAYVTPAALRWARESSGLSVVEAAKRIGIRWSLLERAEEGNDLLTLREAEKAADAYERPLAALFLPAPPEEEPPEAQFRRLPGAPEPPWPPEMQLLGRRVRDRQEAAAELYEILEEEPPWRSASRSFAVADQSVLPTLVRNRLGVGEEEQASWRGQGFDALRAWIDAVEALGVLVMQDGSMSVGLMRGFASTHDGVPAIVVNSKDDPRARAFTVVHELGHLILPPTAFPRGRQRRRGVTTFPELSSCRGTGSPRPSGRRRRRQRWASSSGLHGSSR
jgi:transcriptional regulator with XRE-family HTH domain